ncbi:SurA N-terminal domain-containing protein [Acuticoccus sp.]|uniref:SurA N-terminal domain-containing protein n=1 Tax=Acuticoccus sp. TaxID=1904378 RepID=UPI003B52CD75
MFRFASLVPLGLAVALLCAPGAASAQTTIVAVVNGKAVTSYDLGQRERLLKLTGTKGNLKSKALEELIDEQVQLDATGQAKLTVDEADVDRAIAAIAERVKLSPAKLEQALAQNGVNIGTLRDRIRAQIGFGRLTRTRFSAALQVTEQDLVAALMRDDSLEKEIDTFEYDLHQVIVALPKDPSDQRLASAKATAANVRSSFTSCSDGLQGAKGTRNVVVRQYGRRTHAELPKPIGDAVQDVAVGRLSEPVQTAIGLVMFAVCDKKAMRSTNAAMKALEPDMQSERGDAFVKQYLRQLRRDAVVEIR